MTADNTNSVEIFGKAIKIPVGTSQTAKAASIDTRVAPLCLTT